MKGTLYAFTGSTDGTLRAFTLDPSDGSCTAAGSISVGSDLDFVVLGPDDTTLFVTRKSSVAAYAYDTRAQRFSFVHEADTAGGGTHVAVDPTGTRVLVAHYDEAALSQLDFTPGSGLSNLRRFEPGKNAHQVTIHASGTRVFVPCLGSDHLAQYELTGDGTLSPAADATVAAAGGPRHATLSADGSRAYVLSENSSQVHVFDVDAAGGLQPRPTDSVPTSDDAKYHWSSDLQLTPSESFLYAVNRDPSELVAFRVQAGGGLSREPQLTQALSGEVRAFAIEASGRFLLAGDGNGNLVSYRLGEDGTLRESARTSDLGRIHVTVTRYLS